MHRIPRQPALNRGGAPRKAVDLRPAFRGLCENAQHIVARDAISASDDGGEIAIARVVGGEGGEAVEDTTGLDGTCFGRWGHDDECN